MNENCPYCNNKFSYIKHISNCDSCDANMIFAANGGLYDTAWKFKDYYIVVEFDRKKTFLFKKTPMILQVMFQNMICELPYVIQIDQHNRHEVLKRLLNLKAFS
jgi:hypothetical protein